MKIQEKFNSPETLVLAITTKTKDIPEGSDVFGKDIPIGLTFEGSIGSRLEPSLFIRHYAGILDLGDPERTFTFKGSEPGPDVRNFTPRRVIMQTAN